MDVLRNRCPASVVRSLKCTIPYPFKVIKGCLRQILLGSFLNTFSHLQLSRWNLHMQNWYWNYKSIPFPLLIACKMKHLLILVCFQTTFNNYCLISLFTEGNLINFEKLETFRETIDYNPSTEIFSFLFVLINDR